MTTSRTYWELFAEGEWRKTRLSILLGLLCVAFLGMSVINVRAELQPIYGIRTDLQGHSDVIRVDQAREMREAEVLEFVKQFAFFAFSWTPSTVSDDRRFVEERVTASVRAELPRIIPGYALALTEDPEKGTAPRVSMRIEEAAVRLEEGKAKVELHLAINFWRTDRLPEDPGLVTTDEPDWHHYGVMVRVRQVPRTLDNPYGMLVEDLRRVQLSRTLR